jgi:thiol-disulfide isomerase/thioredoxin
LVGQEARDFVFEDLENGGSIDREALKGKVTAFDFWATWCGYCFRGLPNVQKVYDKFQKNDKVAIFAVNTDEPNVDDDAVKKSFEQAKLHLPIVRDRKKYDNEIFEVEGLPTMVVLDGEGKIQYVHVGYDLNLEQKLTEIIERLLKGENVAQVTLEKHEAERLKYERELNEALIGTTSTVEVPQSKIAKRSEPSTLKLESLWTVDDVPRPGNLLVLEPPGEDPIIYVLSGSKTIAQLGPNGEIKERYELDIPKDVGVSWLRTAADASGTRYFVAFASAQQQFFCFDQSWKRLLAYPDSQHAGLADVQLADLDGDGQPEILAGYWGVVGVQAVSFTGERMWSNRKLENVTRLAISDPADDGRRFVLCVNGRDFITPIDHAGKAQAEIPVAGQSLYALFSADLDGAPPAEMCALSAGEVGVLIAIGLDAKGDMLWSYPLPPGIHSQPVELVTPGRLPTADGGVQGVWLLTSADGSIHILAADGKLIDKFNYGEELTGMAAATFEGRPVLIVASMKGLTAWRVGE